MSKTLLDFSYFLIPLFIAIITICIESKKKRKRFSQQSLSSEQNNNTQPQRQTNSNWTNSYQQRYFFTLNEKTAYQKIKIWANERNLEVFAKVRVLDIIEPRKSEPNYKTLLWKIQAKHVDFVICNQSAKIQCIIELDDNSHNREDRKARDEFLTQALTGAGLKVIHTYAITEEVLNSIT